MARLVERSSSDSPTIHEIGEVPLVSIGRESVNTIQLAATAKRIASTGRFSATTSTAA